MSSAEVAEQLEVLLTAAEEKIARLEQDNIDLTALLHDNDVCVDCVGTRCCFSCGNPFPGGGCYQCETGGLCNSCEREEEDHWQEKEEKHAST